MYIIYYSPAGARAQARGHDERADAGPWWTFGFQGPRRGEGMEINIIYYVLVICYVAEEQVWKQILLYCILILYYMYYYRNQGHAQRSRYENIYYISYISYISFILAVGLFCPVTVLFLVVFWPHAHTHTHTHTHTLTNTHRCCRCGGIWTCYRTTCRRRGPRRALKRLTRVLPTKMPRCIIVSMCK